MVRWIAFSCLHYIKNHITKDFFELHSMSETLSTHASTLIPMNTRAQTLPLGASSKTGLTKILKIGEVTTGASLSRY
jgi:hypothetical protein